MAREDALTVAELIGILQQCPPDAKIAVALDAMEKDDQIYGWIDDELLAEINASAGTSKLLAHGKLRGVIFLRGEQVDRIAMK